MHPSASIHAQASADAEPPRCAIRSRILSPTDPPSTLAPARTSMSVHSTRADRCTAFARRDILTYMPAHAHAKHALVARSWGFRGFAAAPSVQRSRSLPPSPPFDVRAGPGRTSPQRLARRPRPHSTGSPEPPVRSLRSVSVRRSPTSDDATVCV
ncbi:hypothetical protein BD311DRAFT_251804 [Dichomitus squalens]|uniref:Uncharacterized protein n=1 Tax=Dichomitus squalens TaxID=114155 RepID=A0A4Q9MTS3_9APHY|nr:hypothetical protein BD311DRAFT_251804 [Dichomitus squalens]